MNHANHITDVTINTCGYHLVMTLMQALNVIADYKRCAAPCLHNATVACPMDAERYYNDDK